MKADDVIRTELADAIANGATYVALCMRDGAWHCDISEGVTDERAVYLLERAKLHVIHSRPGRDITPNITATPTGEVSE